MPTAGETWYADSADQWHGFKRAEYPYAYAEDTVIRYIDLHDARDLESIVAYVSALADITSLKINNETVAGTWKTYACGYEPVNPSVVGGPIRLWHSLIPAGLATADAPHVTENNCTYKVSLTFYWRQTALMNPVTAGESGVTYAITGVNRDKLSGLYDYIVEKREQITTYVAAHKVAETQFETVTEQKFLGVREASYRSGVYTLTDAGVAPTGWWDTAVQTQGTLYNVTISKNENCTADVTQRRTVAKLNVETAVQRERTAFSDTETKTTRNATVPLNAYVTVAGGVLVVQGSKLNDDGTYDNTVVTKTAIAHEADVTRETTAFSAFVSITLRNQPAAINAAVAVTGGIVTRRMSRKNADGTFDNTEETRTAIPLSAVVTRSRTAFSDATSITLRNQPTPVDAYVNVVNGIITTRTSKRNDDGTFDNTEETRTAIPSDAVVTRSLTALLSTYGVTLRNQAAAVNAFVAVTGGTVTTRTSKKNDDGTFDNTEETRTALAAQSTVERTRTAFWEQVTITASNQATPVDAYVSVTGGSVVTRTSRLTEFGTYDNTEQIRTAIASDSTVTRTKTVFGTILSVTLRNQAVAVNAYVDVVNGAVVTRSSRKNEDGTYDNTEETRTAIEGASTVERTRTIFWEQVSTTVRNQAAAVDAYVAVVGGVVYTRSSKRNDDGTYDNNETIRTAIAGQGSLERVRTKFSEQVTTTLRNQAAQVVDYVVVADGIVTSRTSRRNDDGTYDNSETLRTELAVSSAATSMTKTKYATTVGITNRGQASAAADPTVPGVTVKNTLTENGRYAQDTDTITPTAVTDARKTQDGDFTETVVRRLNRNQAAPDATTTGLTLAGTANAKITRITNEYNDLDKVDVFKDEETPKAAWLQAFTLSVDDDTTATILPFTNQTVASLQSVLTALGNVGQISASMGPNKWGLINGTITVTVRDDGVTTSRTAFTHACKHRVRQPNGEVIEYSGTAVMGFNVSDGMGVYYDDSVPSYQGSAFYDIGGNWYKYVKFTSYAKVT